MNQIRGNLGMGKYMLPSCNDQKDNDGVIPKDHDGIISAFSNIEFSSPLQVTPIFRSLAAGIPSPKFSESERQFLLKTLGMESPSCNPNNNTGQLVGSHWSHPPRYSESCGTNKVQFKKKTARISHSSQRL
ncbi:Transcription factor MYB88 [Camellia lanceoleosa]|uniref:Transcription factor MYB88 n=1 Tax=Camellia lanceoleosa TaxID=1840588 RepID=A0ACC0FA07_9ERIC|nr:Transcription factor MYB88 [Camellia lanceoleosa]